MNEKYTMSEPEIKAWLSTLAPTTAGRIKMIQDLLRHANGDEMSAEDRTICTSVLLRLESGEEIVPELREVTPRPKYVGNEDDWGRE